MTSINTSYGYKAVFKNLILLLVLLFSCKYTNSAAFCILFLPMAVALFSSKQLMLLQVVFYSMLLMVINQWLVPKSNLFAMSQKLLLLSASFFLFFKIFGKRQNNLIKPIFMLLPYVLFMVFSSMFGFNPMISYLKLVLWSSVMLAFISATILVSNDRKVTLNKVREIFISVAIFLVVGSILLSFFPAIGYLTPEELVFSSNVLSLLKGVTNHSQSLGPITVVVVVLLIADNIFSLQKFDLVYFSLILGGLYLIYCTHSRTSMGSIIASLGFVFFLAMKGNPTLGKRWQRKIAGFVMFGVFSIGIFISLYQPIQREIIMFALKTTKTESQFDVDTMLASRSSLLDLAMYNFRQSPIIGNGFQVSIDMKNIKINGIKDMLTAPVEKSTWVYAILEEGGVIGMSLFMIFVITMFVLLLKRGGYVASSVLFAFLLVNLGEFSIFSISGMGGVIWALFFMALIMDSKRRDEQNFLNRAVFFNSASF
jgi:hypothetical protein